MKELVQKMVSNINTHPLLWMLLFLIFGLTASFFATSFFLGNTLSASFVGLLVFIVLLKTTDFIFNMFHFMVAGVGYKKPKKIPFENIYVVPHPYIPFVNKKNVTIGERRPANYPLHKGKYYFDQYKTNNFGFSDGLDGGRDIVIPKPSDLIRVVCLGASTTGNYIEADGKSYSYPMELEKIIQSELDWPVEIINCGQGGYNSADILTRFVLQIIDAEPDVVILYHAYNDIQMYLTEGFETDYSHARMNLSESYWKLRVASKVPSIPFDALNYLSNKSSLLNVQNNLLEIVKKGSFNMFADYSRGLLTYQRNLQTIVDVCKSRNIKVILSTYCHFLHKSIESDPLHKIYKTIVHEENSVIRKIAAKSETEIVDNAQLVPHDENYFVDSIHFTPAGMQLLASNFAEVLLRLIRDQDRGNVNV